MYIETLKIRDAEIKNFSYHQRRAYQSSAFLLEPPEVPEEWSRGLVKCRMVYSTRLHSVQFVAYQKKEIKSLKIIEVRENRYAKKYEDRSWIHSLFEQRGSCDEVLIALEGKLTDTSFCNLVFENEKGLFTPSTPLLKGTKRASLLEKGLIRERDISVGEISYYDKIHLINAMLDLGELCLEREAITP